TRSDRDWSSDVCSSDLRARPGRPASRPPGTSRESLRTAWEAPWWRKDTNAGHRRRRILVRTHGDKQRNAGSSVQLGWMWGTGIRSEERRVGKEGREGGG